MKTLFKILGILILIILLLALLLPVVFKGKIFEIAKTEINKSVNARVDFGDLSLSLFRSFPNFSLQIDNLLIIGNDEFEKDTLAHIRELDVTIDLFSVINGSNYEIKKIAIIKPDFYIHILKDGKANYDISMPSETTTSETTAEPGSSAFKLMLKKVEMSDAKIIYDDASLGMVVTMLGSNHTLRGDLTEDVTNLNTLTSIDQLTVKYEGIDYISKAHAIYKADINADLKNEIYTLKDNELQLNELFLKFDGSVSYVGEDLNIVMTFSAAKTDFKNLLSMVPAVYAKDFNSVETSGKLALDGYVKGIYTETSLPAFGITINVENAMFKYPDLPKAVTDINIKTSVTNEGGDADNTVIDVSSFHLKLGDNPVDMTMLLKTPVSDPDIDGHIVGTMDLASVKNFYPLEKGDELTGSLNADVTLKGKMSAIENQQYQDFTAIGSVLIKNLSYTSSMLNKPVEISNAQLNFSPQYLDLVSFITKIGENDFEAHGKLENYLAYALKDEMLKGQLETNSTYFNISALMPETESASETTTTTDTSAMSVVEVPGNIDFTMNSKFEKLIYDNIEMDHVTGKLIVKNKTVTLDELMMNILDGKMALNGNYNTIDPEKPAVDFDINIDRIDIQKAYNTFGIISKYAPIAKKTSGKFSTNFSMKANLDQHMNLDYQSMTGEGKLETTPIKVQDVNTLNKLADALKMENLKSLDISKIMLEYKFVDGKILVEPFDMKIGNLTSKLGGSTGFDQSIDYVMSLNIPRAALGSAANDVLSNLVNQANSKGANFSLGETVSVDALIGGTLSEPTVKTGLKETGKNLVEDIKNQVKEEFEKKKEEITAEARAKAQKILDDANQQAQKIIDEANKQAENIRKNAADASKKLRDEGEKQATQVEAEGKKKGFLAEAAAKESAKKIRQEADKNATKLTTEADTQANNVVSKANQEAENIKKNAQAEADKLLGK